jgi:hypothetical protein
MMIWRGYVLMEKIRNAYKISAGKTLPGRFRNRMIILNSILNKQDLRIWIGFISFMDQWRAPVNTVTKLRDLEKAGYLTR